MKFYALLPVRDEADIILESLEALSQWADGIFIFDTGSVDDTWKLIEDFSRTSSKILWKERRAVFFTDTAVRGALFNVAREYMREGDWFLRVDADEFHDVSPPSFVAKHLRSFESVVWHQYFNFELLEGEATNLRDPVSLLKERTLPISERRCWYSISEYSEPRMFRYRETMKWPDLRSQPYNGGIRAVARLPIRHYPHRDPLQLAKRCALRSITMKSRIAHEEWRNPEHHWRIDDWREFLFEQKSAQIFRRDPGSPMPLTNFPLDMKLRLKRDLLRVYFKFLVRQVDRFRPSWTGSEKLVELPQEFQTQVETCYRNLEEGD